MAEQPAVARLRRADRRQRLGAAGTVRQLQPATLERPLQEVGVAVGEAGQHAAAVEVEPLVPDGVDLALADVHAPGDQVARHRQRGHLRQTRIHRVDRAVVQDHGRLR